jgi:hypothetical protein
MALDANDLHRQGRLPKPEDARPFGEDLTPANDAPTCPSAPLAMPRFRAPCGGSRFCSSASTLLPVVYATELARPIEPLRWLSEELSLIQGRVLIFAGYADAAKTWGGMDIAFSVAAGDDRALGGVDIGISGDVVHIDFEQQEWITRWRYQRLAFGRGADLAALGPRLGLVSLPPLTLTDPRAESALCDLLDGKAFALVDNLTAGCPELDQNGSTVAAPLYMLGRVSAKTGCTIAVIHHENKTSADGQAPNRPRAQQMRGSGAISGAAGGAVAFTNEGKCIFRFQQTKETMGPAPEPRFFQLVDVGDVDPVTKRSMGIRLEWTPKEQAQAIATNAASVAKAIIRRYLEVHGPKPKNDILEQARGAGTPEKRRALDAMIEAGEVLTERAGRAIICRLPEPT